MTEPLLRVRDLKVQFHTSDGVVKAVDGVSFDIDRGETLGVVGESGSGKSVTFLTVMGLVNRRYAHVEGEIVFEGRDLLKLPDSEIQKVRGDGIAMVFQDPMTSLHPMYRVGDQIAEAILAHRDVPKKEAHEQAVEMLRRVGMPLAERRARQWPHEFSGGMRQRAMIAMALALNPSLIIADEPTTALDVTVQAQILELIERLKEEFNVAVAMITHDLGVIADVAQNVMVMYAGRVMEFGARDVVFGKPLHPYTWGLLESIPHVDQKGSRLVPIAGSPPSLINVPAGCPFHPRCPHRFDPCDKDRPALVDRGGGHPNACHLTPEDKQRLWAERESRRAKAPV
ncbi:MAG TPA: ABC transporter ATP-binding protein [Actinomycetota bacterium]|nr:ABC transporter ATP-binding protein [Actinomycetota bacterium]